MRMIATLLDSQFSVFGYRIGIDSLIGLVPVLGDAISTIFGLYLVWEARQLGVPNDNLNRMWRRVLVDLVVGSVPVIGDIFDVFYKSNARNFNEVEAIYEDGFAKPIINKD